MKIGVLTGGGDCPGLNAAIRAVVRSALSYGFQVVGIREGWNGLYKQKFIPLTLDKTSGLLPLGGTILGTSRVNPLKIGGGLKRCFKNFQKNKLHAIVSIGGEGSLKIASTFSHEGMPIVSIPKTIDNDVWGTDSTIGFDTAVQVACEAIDRLHSTAESHKRVIIVEVMGRHVGWIATFAGMAAGGDAILIPEEPFEMRKLCQIIRQRGKRNKFFSIFVVSEDARIQLENGKILKTPTQRDEYGDVKLEGIGELLAKELRRLTSVEVRVTVLGHVQRGGTPTAFDRVLATRFGVYAVDLIDKKKFGRLVVLRGTKIESIPIAESVGKIKPVSPELIKMSSVFFG